MIPHIPYLERGSIHIQMRCKDRTSIFHRKWDKNLLNIELIRGQFFRGKRAPGNRGILCPSWEKFSMFLSKYFFHESRLPGSVLHVSDQDFGILPVHEREKMNSREESPGDLPRAEDAIPKCTSGSRHKIPGSYFACFPMAYPKIAGGQS